MEWRNSIEMHPAGDMKRLGDYIRLVDVRNVDLAVKRLLGVNKDKEFMPSIANTIGTDMSTYKVVMPYQFAYGPVTSRNGDKLSVALYQGKGAVIISQAYTIFEVKDCNELLPEYLMMWFRRSEFDRYARFKSHGSAREIFSWEEMCDVWLPVPALSRQREMVDEYETLTRRIHLNRQLIAKLEETAQALYRKNFVDGIDKEQLPNGWRLGTLGEIAEISSGKTCVDRQSQRKEPYVYPVTGAAGVIGYSSCYNQDERLMTTGRVGTLGVVNRYNGKIYTADNVLVVKSKFYEYCYQTLNALDYIEISKGGVQSLITQTDLASSETINPDEKVLCGFEDLARTIFRNTDCYVQENKLLADLQSLLLTRIGQ